MHFIELPKLPKNEEIKDVFDAWMEFIENPISNKLQKVEMTIQEIKEAKNELLRLSTNNQIKSSIQIDDVPDYSTLALRAKHLEKHIYYLTT
ncbi:hypothetical protein [uncultured Clostridium sp.]|uniref:hypothetical protein n=1 Tax=uncultured Clostridium sp. TaxID=59620 RepID=UPI0034A0B5AA